tara:strand:- start:41540 stop:42223 length:684 start_codon:yes stop_codon:yes gene_type:complete
MKYLFLFITFFGTLLSFGQFSGANTRYFDQVKSSLLIDSFKYQKTTKNDNFYLFDTWSNPSQIIQNNKIYKLNTLNYNIRNDRFEAKFEKDSVFVLNSPKDVIIKINNKKFIRFIHPETQRLTFFECIADFNGESLLIGYGLKIEKGVINPLTKEANGPDILAKKEDYFYTNGITNNLQKVKLNKKTICNLIDEEKLTELKKFIKTNRLKYNRVSDVSKILEFYNSI